MSTKRHERITRIPFSTILLLIISTTSNSFSSLMCTSVFLLSSLWLFTSLFKFRNKVDYTIDLILGIFVYITGF